MIDSGLGQTVTDTFASAVGFPDGQLPTHFISVWLFSLGSPYWNVAYIKCFWRNFPVNLLFEFVQPHSVTTLERIFFI